MTKAYKKLMLLCLLLSAVTLSARTVYLQPETWDNGEVKFAAYTLSPGAGSFASGFMTAVSGEEVYQTTIADNVTKLRFYRFSSSRTEPSLDGEWEVTVDLDVDPAKNVFIFSGKNDDSKIIGSWGVIDELKTFDLIFKDNGSEVDVDYMNLMLLSGESKNSDFLTKGSDVVASFSDVTEADLINGRAIVNARKGRGVLMRDAAFTINLVSPRKLDRIEVLALKYNDTNNGLIVNGSTINKIDSGRYVVDCKDKVVSSITIATPEGKSIYVLALNIFDSKSGNSHVYLADWLNDIGTFTANGTCSKAGDGSMQFANNYNSKTNYFEVLPSAGMTFNSGDTIAATYLRKAAGTAVLEIYDAAGTKLFTTDEASTTEQAQKFVLTSATDRLLIARGTGSSTTLYVPDFSVFQKYVIPTITVSKATKTALGQEKNSTSKNPYRVQGIVKAVTLDYEASNKKAIDEGLSELANTVSMIIVDSKDPEGEPIELYACSPSTSGDVTVVAGAPLVVEGKLTHKFSSSSSVAINNGSYKIQKYLVDFVSESKVLQRDSMRYGAMPSYKGVTPTKEKTAKWTYTFKGWNKTIVPVTEDVSYIALFDSTINFYNVTLVLEDAWRFEGYEGKKTIELEKSSMAYGTFVSQLYADKYLKMDLHNKQYSYQIISWNPAYDVVTGDVEYKAVLDSTVRSYMVEFGFSNIIFQSGLVEYGQMPEYTSEVPTRDPNGAWSYVFRKWEPELHIVEGPQTYTARFDSTTVKYEVTFYDYNYKVLKSEDMAFGSIPVEPTPTRPATVEWTYTFKGWDEPVVAVTSPKTYVAVYDSVRNKYQIDFLDYDGSVLKSTQEEYGAVPYCTSPHRDATAQWTYSFKYWDKDIVRVKGAETYTAMYDSVVNKYTIYFYNYDGTLLERKEVAYGVVPAYTGSMPTRPPFNNVNYEFSGWSPTPVPVTKNASYYANFDGAENAFRIIFANYDGSELQSELVPKGQQPVYKGETPTREDSPEYSYTFKGWDKAIVAATVGVVYTALYDSIERVFQVSFENYDGTVLQSGIYHYGDMPVYNGETPTHPASAQFVRTFAGWDKKIEPVTASVVYTARYDLTLVNYLVEFIDYDGTVLSADSVGYGIVPTYNTPYRKPTAAYTYYFNGWDKPIVYVTEDAKYYAKYDSIVNQYEVKFVSDGKVMQTLVLNYGAMPSYSGSIPKRSSTDRCSYEFKGWDPQIDIVTKDIIYEAVFDSVMKKVYITFLNYDGKQLYRGRYEYNSVPTYPKADPTHPADAQYTYVFMGWTPQLSPVDGETTYTALYDSIPVTYNIQFVNYDGTLLQEGEVRYGVIPEYNQLTPEHVGSEFYSYTFKGWTPALAAVTGSAVYKAQFDSTRVAYSISFVNYNGELLDKHVEKVGDMPFFEGAVPQKQESTQWTYIFAGWSPKLHEVNGEATYTATFDSIAKRYAVEFVNYNGVTLQSNRLSYGDMPKYEGATPIKPETDDYQYIFAGWEPQIAAVTQDIVYTAVFDSVPTGYEIKFVNYDGILLQSGKVGLNVLPQYRGQTPVHPNSAQWSYTFKGWTPDVVPATASAIYTATFDSVLNKYKVQFVNYDGKVLQSNDVEYGKVPTYTGAEPKHAESEQYDYIFAGWTPDIVSVAGNALYTAKFDSIRCYRISIEPAEGFTVKGEGRYQVGAEAVLEAVPAATYRFISWSDNVTDNPRKIKVSADMNFSIVFERDSFEVVLNADAAMGTVTGAGVYLVGSEVVIEAVANEGFEFVQWSDGVKEARRTLTITADITLTAEFKHIEDGLQNLNETGWITIVGRDIYVSAPDDLNVSVYTISGQMFYNGAERIISLPQAGSYIVRIDKYASKIMVK